MSNTVNIKIIDELKPFDSQFSGLSNSDIQSSEKCKLFWFLIIHFRVKSYA